MLNERETPDRAYFGLVRDTLLAKSLDFNAKRAVSVDLGAETRLVHRIALIGVDWASATFVAGFLPD